VTEHLLHHISCLSIHLFTIATFKLYVVQRAQTVIGQRCWHGDLLADADRQNFFGSTHTDGGSLVEENLLMLTDADPGTFKTMINFNVLFTEVITEQLTCCYFVNY